MPLVLKNGEIAPRRKGRRRVAANTSSEPWSPAEERRLRDLAGTVQVRQIARILTDEFGVPRTKAAVNTRAKLLGVSLWWDGYSQNQVAALFGVTFTTVGRWRTDGLLRCEAWEVGRGPRGQWRVAEQDLIAFISSHTWAYGVEPMQPGPLRSRAELAHRRDPWLTCERAAQLMGVSRELLSYYCKRGMVPHRRRVAGCGLPKIVVRAADIPGLRDELRAHALSNIRAAVARRWQQRGAAA